ncbi:MAG: hypothetical protein A3J24_04930 [Deltaproteobacteria bacterium RIFCSPLOWO2_02_FULL_53_8]|nr:MAG: hypothetical protein A3J24_04930 [Deltaproteobacteria bacterium RIFCSPLOWO2_02_FULL_53_8]
MGANDKFENLDQLQLAAVSAGLLPCITRERWAELQNLSHATVYSMCDRGYLPTIHFGRRVFINIEALRAQCAAKVFK